MNRLAPLLVLALLAWAAAAEARGDVKLPAIFGDHMVLQRGRPVPVWGEATPGERVTVRAAGQERSTMADARGRWRVTLDPIASAGPVELTVSGNNTVTLRDVVVGEVWLCAGQSNMGFALKGASNAAEALRSADRPTVRLFSVGRAHPETPQPDVTGQWAPCTPESAADFSAVAYFFGRDLNETLDMPVGLIKASWGGTRAEAWLPRPTFDALKLPYEPAWTNLWLGGKAMADGKPRPHNTPAGLYNGMIAPLAGFAVRGVVWYQGETNTAYPREYRDVLAALITSWRDAWAAAGGAADEASRDFPFLVVQLPNFETRNRDWAALRAAQAEVARTLPNVGLAVTIDLGDPKDVHPRNKQPVGERVARLAERIAYGRDVPHAGPTFKSVDVREDKVTLRFDHAFGGLKTKGDELLGFEVAGPDGKFAPARAEIDGDTVVVRTDGVVAPAAVRYGWTNSPTCTLYNAADLPAAPFEAKLP